MSVGLEAFSGRRAASIRMDAGYCSGVGTSCIRRIFATPGYRLAPEPTGVGWPGEIRVDRADPDLRSDRRGPGPVGPAGSGRTGVAAHPAEIWLSGSAQR